MDKMQAEMEAAMNEKFERILALLNNKHGEVKLEDVELDGELAWMVVVDTRSLLFNFAHQFRHHVLASER